MNKRIQLRKTKQKWRSALSLFLVWHVPLKMRADNFKKRVSRIAATVSF